jgi:glutamate synthase (NADPH/NADH) large chain
MAPMATTGQEAIGSMGTDTPISAMSNKSKLLYTYFKQNFAQVTNPPIDPIREELVMSLVSFIGPRPNIFDLEGASKRKRLEVRQPILTNGDLEKIRSIGHTEDLFDTKTLDTTYKADKGATAWPSRSSGCASAPSRRCMTATTSSSCRTADRTGPDRDPGPAGDGGGPSPPDPQGPAHLGRSRRRIRRSRAKCIISASGRLWRRGDQPLSRLRHAARHACQGRISAGSRPLRGGHRYIKSIGKGILKVMSKMGISTYQSYCGAQIFDAVGLSTEFVRSISPAPRRRSRASAWPRSPRNRAAPPRRSPTIRC